MTIKACKTIIAPCIRGKFWTHVAVSIDMLFFNHWLHIFFSFFWSQMLWSMLSSHFLQGPLSRQCNRPVRHQPPIPRPAAEPVSWTFPVHPGVRRLQPLWGLAGVLLPPLSHLAHHCVCCGWEHGRAGHTDHQVKGEKRDLGLTWSMSYTCMSLDKCADNVNHLCQG